MRELLFRGKQLNDKGWFHGNLLHLNKKTFLVPKNAWFKQFTGLTDKNGRKIFEGDIVRINRFNYEYVGEVIYNNKTSGFEVCYFSKVGAYGARAMHTVLICHTFWVEVIGNIHDNPDLLC